MSKNCLILYAYYETSEYKRNLEYFLKYGIYKDDYYIRHYTIIINGNCSIDFKKYNYPIELVTILERENKGYDFGAWAHALQELDLIDYDYFIFINSTVIGPILPSYVDIKSWPHLFTDMINDKVKLVGTTVNAKFKLHIQSMFFVTDKIGLKLLKDKDIFTDNDKDTKVDVINKRELKMTEEIIKAGYKINCIFPLMKDVDYNDDKVKQLGDIYYNKGIIGGYEISPLDVIFFKTNRKFGEKEVDKYLYFANFD